MRPKCAWTLKESFGRDGKKLSGIGGAIGIEQRGYSCFVRGLKRRKLRPHHFAPRQSLLACSQCRCAVRGVVLVIELVSEFVNDKILAVRRVSRTALGRIPCQD